MLEKLNNQENIENSGCKILKEDLGEDLNSSSTNTVWVNRKCEPTVVPITSSCKNKSAMACSEVKHCLSNQIRTQSDSKMDLSVCISSERQPGESRELLLGENREDKTSTTSKNYKSNVSLDQASSSSTCYNKMSIKPSNYVQKNGLSDHQDEIRTKPTLEPNTFTIHVNTSSTPGNRHTAGVTSSLVSKEQHTVCSNAGEFSKLKTSSTAAFPSVSAILEILNRSVQDVVKKNNDAVSERVIAKNNNQKKNIYGEKLSPKNTIVINRKPSAIRTVSTSNPITFKQITVPNPGKIVISRNTNVNKDDVLRKTEAIRSTTDKRHVVSSVGSNQQLGHFAPKPTHAYLAHERISFKRNDSEAESKIKRPMNAFMVWAKEHRPILANVFNGLTNSQISVKLGEMWNALPKDQKQGYYDKADIIKRQHKRDFPGWVYQPRPAKKRRESKYSLANLFPSEEAMNEHMMTMQQQSAADISSLSSYRKMSANKTASAQSTMSSTSLAATTNVATNVSSVQSQKFVLEPLQVNPDNPKEFTCMMKSIHEHPTNQESQLVHVMPILKPSSEETKTAIGQMKKRNQTTISKDVLKMEESSITPENVMWSPMKTRQGSKHANLLRYPVQRLHLDFDATHLISNNQILEEELHDDKIQHCLESAMAPIHSISETSVELNRIFNHMTNDDDDEDEFQNAEWLSAHAIEILTDVEMIPDGCQ
ncbi:uncharacterized protein [Antedon mediterranea]